MSKYKVLGTNDIKKFVHIMMRCKISQHIAMTIGIDDDQIEEVNRLAQKRKISILVIPDDMVTDKDLTKIYIFVPMGKNANGYYGVFVPMPDGEEMTNYKSFIEAPIINSEDIVKLINDSRVLPDGGMSQELSNNDMAQGEMISMPIAFEGKRGKVKKSVELIGRPKRQDAIGDDDETFLRYMLNKKDITLDDFLNSM